MENKTAKKREYLTISITDPDLRERLMAVAKKEYRSVSRQAALFIEQGLAALDLQYQRSEKLPPRKTRM
jgi:hypothetical protein